MISISAKELRLNLSEYLQRAMHGEEIEVIYRSRPAVRLSPANAGPARGSAAAFRAAMASLPPEPAPHQSTLDPNQPVKELYHELLASDSKYGSPS